jgi:hypothetical protein
MKRQTVCGLGVVAVLTAVFAAPPSDLVSAGVFSGSGKQAGEKAATVVDRTLKERICEAIKKHGIFCDPDFSYVFEAKRVRGSKLQFVRFMQRDESGNKCADVGVALEIELLGLEEGQLQAHFLQARWHQRGGLSGFTLLIPPQRAEAQGGRGRPEMTPEQKKFLQEADCRSPVDKALERAFGPECDELFLRVKNELPHLGVVMAYDEVKVDEKGLGHLTSFSLAQFGKAEGQRKPKLLAMVRNTVATITFVDAVALDRAGGLKEDLTAPVTFECANGVRLRLEPAKADRKK